MTRTRDLEKRLRKISEPIDETPSPGLLNLFARWLTIDEIAEWKAIYETYYGEALKERELQFSREMRRRHPGMPPLTTEDFDEMIRQAGEAYEAAVLASEKEQSSYFSDEKES